MKTRSGMIRRGIGAALLALLLSPAVVHADEGERGKAEEVLALFELPAAVMELRETGIAEEQVREALRAFREAPAREGEAERPTRRSRDATDAIRAEVETSREHGPTENFGSFVRQRVQEDGLRGQELSDRIREERATRRAERGGEAQERRGEAQERREAAVRQRGERGGAGRAGEAQEGADSRRGVRERPGRPGQEPARPSVDRDRGERPGAIRGARGSRGGDAEEAAAEAAEEAQESADEGSARPTR